MGSVFKDPPVHGKPTGRRERKKLDTRRRIFSSAFELFREKGFEGTTVEEIAERADVGKGTVFNYFPQKTAFLLATYREWEALVSEELGPPRSWKGPARTKLNRVFGHMADVAVRHRGLARLIIFETMRQSHLKMAQEADESADEEGASQTSGDAGNEPEGLRVLETMTREVIRLSKQEAEIRPEVDVEQATSLIAAAAFHTLVRGLVRGASAQEIKGSLSAKMDIIFTGLSP